MKMRNLVSVTVVAMLAAPAEHRAVDVDALMLKARNWSLFNPFLKVSRVMPTIGASGSASDTEPNYTTRLIEKHSEKKAQEDYPSVGRKNYDRILRFFGWAVSSVVPQEIDERKDTITEPEKLADSGTSLFALPDELFYEVVDSIVPRSTGNEEVFYDYDDTIESLYKAVQNRFGSSHPNSYKYLTKLVEERAPMVKKGRIGSRVLAAKKNQYLTTNKIKYQFQVKPDLVNFSYARDEIATGKKAYQDTYEKVKIMTWNWVDAHNALIHLENQIKKYYTSNYDFRQSPAETTERIALILTNHLRGLKEAAEKVELEVEFAQQGGSGTDTSGSCVYANKKVATSFKNPRLNLNKIKSAVLSAVLRQYDS